MSKNYGQSGVGRDVQYGKAGGRIIYSPVDGKFTLTSLDGVTLTNLELSNLTAVQANVGDIQISTNTITNSQTNNNVRIEGNGSGIVEVENIGFSGNTLSSIQTDGNINISPDGTGLVIVSNLQVNDLDENRIVTTTTNGRVQTTPNLTFDSSTGVLSIVGELNVGDMNFDGSTISTTNTDGDITIAPDGNGSLNVNANDSNFTGSVSIAGDLTVSGTTTTIDTQDLIVEDNIIGLNKGVDSQTTNVFDTGFIFFRGDQDSAAFIWKESDDKFVLGTTEDSSIGAPGTITVDLGTLQVLNLEATQVDVGDLQLNNNRITSTDTDANIELQPDGSGIIIVTGKSATAYANDIAGEDNAIPNKKYVDDNIEAAVEAATDATLSGNITSVKGVVDLSVVGTQNIGELIPENSDVVRVYFDVTTASDEETTVSVGYSGQPDVFMIVDENDPEMVGLYIADLRHNVGGTERQAQATVATPGSTGSATVIIEFRLPTVTP